MNQPTPAQLRAMTKEQVVKECMRKEHYIIRLKNINRSQSHEIEDLRMQMELLRNSVPTAKSHGVG